jgi:hypothetical protein
MSLHDLFLAPFADFAFMRRALVATLALALGCGPVGVVLVLRRMSLVGDSMSHAVLPGAAVGFLVSGLSLPAMSVGGFVAGMAVALLAGVVTRYTGQREDASFAAFYLISLAAGVVLVSARGSSVDLMHVLFGTVLAVDDGALILVAAITTLTLLVLATTCFGDAAAWAGMIMWVEQVAGELPVRIALVNWYMSIDSSSAFSPSARSFAAPAASSPKRDISTSSTT